VSYDRWSHRRDPDLDDEPGDDDPGRPQLPAGASRYGWFVGVVGILVLAWITLNTLRTDAIQTGVKVGTKLPPFAVHRVTVELPSIAPSGR